MPVTRYYPMELSPVSALADGPLGGMMIKACYEEGLEYFEREFEEKAKSNARAFCNKWNDSTPTDLYNCVVMRQKAPCKETWKILDRLDPDATDDKDLNDLRDDCFNAFNVGLWTGFTNLMERIGGAYIED